MRITQTEIFKLTIPMEPFVIATETSYYTQNIFIRIHTDSGLIGMGECSAFPMLVGETQNTCYEVAKDLARIIKGKDPLPIEERMEEFHQYIAFNSTIKSAFDIALHDLAAKAAEVPLYVYLGGKKKPIQTDLTIGIAEPKKMAATAIEFVKNGVQTIKVKLGKNYKEDVERIRLIREAVGPEIKLRTDANQGWNYDEALYAFTAYRSLMISSSASNRCGIGTISYYHNYASFLLLRSWPMKVYSIIMTRFALLTRKLAIISISSWPNREEYSKPKKSPMWHRKEIFPVC
jgi:L-alanine-DL-glutamate epimerase-like enolase superfamily enzyme